MKMSAFIMSGVRATGRAQQWTGVTWLALEQEHSGHPEINDKHCRSFSGNLILIEN